MASGNTVVEPREILTDDAFLLSDPQQVAVGLSTGTFSDSDPGDSLTFSASLAGGAALPAWLVFDANAGAFWHTRQPPSFMVCSGLLRPLKMPSRLMY